MPSESHFGRAGHPNPPTNCRRPGDAPALHGEDREEEDQRREQTGEVAEEIARARARRNPTPTPRKLASSTKFVKNDR